MKKRLLAMEELEDDFSSKITEEPWELEEEVQDSMNENASEIEALDRTVMVLESLYELLQVNESVPSISTEHMKTLNIGIQMALAGTNYQPSQLVPGMESWNDQISLEDINSAIEKNLDSISGRLVANIKTIGNNVTQFVAIFDYQLRELKALKSRVQSLPNDYKGSVSLKGSKYLLRNDEVVKNFDEYVKYFQSDIGILTQIFKRSIEFQEGSFLQSIKTLFRLLSDKAIMDYSDRLSDLIKDFISITHAKTRPAPSGLAQVTGKYYVSDFFLGMYGVECFLPEFDKKDMKAYKSNSMNYIVSVVPGGKGSDTSTGVTFDNISKKDMLALIDACEKSAETFKLAQGLVSKLAHIESFLTFRNIVKRNNSAAMAAASGDAPGAMLVMGLPFLFTNYRLLLMTEAIVASTTSSAFVACKGNVKFAKGLISKAM